MALLRLSDVNLTCLPALLPACLRPQTNDVPRQCRSSLQRDDAARGGGDLLGALPCAAGALPCARPSPARSGSSSPLSERGLKLPPYTAIRML